jgi:hypothetical protein
MKRSRLLNFSFVVLFAAVVVGAQFHSHAGNHEQIAAHCKTCHVSHAVYDFVSIGAVPFSAVSIPYSAQQRESLSIVERVDNRSKRAPPIC